MTHAANENTAHLLCDLRMASDFSPTGLRVLREVAQTGSFSAAAVSLGYTQSAISRQVAALEAAAGRRLFDRGRHGVTLTSAGARLLPSAVRVLDELDTARRELSGEQAGGRPVRLGAFATAAAGFVPKALAMLRPQLNVSLREATTPALVACPPGGHARSRTRRPGAAIPPAGRAVARFRAHDALGARAGHRRPGQSSARARSSRRGLRARRRSLGREPIRCG